MPLSSRLSAADEYPELEKTLASLDVLKCPCLDRWICSFFFCRAFHSSWSICLNGSPFLQRHQDTPFLIVSTSVGHTNPASMSLTRWTPKRSWKCQTLSGSFQLVIQGIHSRKVAIFLPKVVMLLQDDKEIRTDGVMDVTDVFVDDLLAAKQLIFLISFGLC